jgi:LysM repeat protein
MIYPRQPANTKVCPGCSTRLIDTARRCLVCGYIYPDDEVEASYPQNPPVLQQRVEPRPPRRSLQVTLSLPLLVGLIVILLAMNTLAILGWQKREVTQTQVAGANATSTYVATIYVSPTATVTATRTAAPPTATVERKIEYTVASGDSCLSVSYRFKVSLDSLLAENKQVDCGLLPIGTVLTIPKPTATPEPTLTRTPKP